MKRRLEGVKPHSGGKFPGGGTPAPNPDLLPPKFCLRLLRDGYGVNDCTKDEQAAFAQRLFELSRMSWAQLRLAPRHGQGYEKIAQSAIRGDHLPPEVSRETNLIAFRCIGRAPMVGFRDLYGVFNIIWIDRNFDLYDHG